MLKIIHLNQSTSAGGAARAAYRLHKALLESGNKSSFWTASNELCDDKVFQPNRRHAKYINHIRYLVSSQLCNGLTRNSVKFSSLCILPSFWHRRINRTDADIINLHWTQWEMMSIEDIGRIKKPLVWTLHDMWPFCGAEHYTEASRWFEGYTQNNSSLARGESDIDRWTWERKRKSWKSKMMLIAPSNWIASCASNSALMGGWPIKVIHNPIDTYFWTPIDRVAARKLLGIDKSSKLILFSAIDDINDRRKGLDLLISSLYKLKSLEQIRFELLIVGGRKQMEQVLGHSVKYTGLIKDDKIMRLYYSAANVVAVPSRIDNLPNIAVEAMSCGTPVVGFEQGGMPDIITHLVDGYLAKTWDTADFAHGLLWAMSTIEEADLRSKSRMTAKRLFSHENVISSYLSAYKEALEIGCQYSEEIP